MSDLDLNELLYVDTRRLDSYYQQAGSPKRRWLVFKKPKFTLSATPSVEVEASIEATTPNLFEKISSVRRALDDRFQLTFHRPNSNDPNVDAVEEICLASRVTVNRARWSQESGSALVLWICQPPASDNTAGPLVLIEGYQASDHRAMPAGPSGFSVLAALIYGARTLIDRSILSAQFAHQPPPELGKFGTKTHPWSYTEHRTVSRYMAEFAADPVNTLKSWDCNVDLERRIHVVYKVREWGREKEKPHRTTTFGYPLWIFAAA